MFLDEDVWLRWFLGILGKLGILIENFHLVILSKTANEDSFNYAGIGLSRIIYVFLVIVLGTVRDTFGEWKFTARGKGGSPSPWYMGHRLRRRFLSCSCNGDLQIVGIRWVCNSEERWILWTGRRTNLAGRSKFPETENGIKKLILE